MSGVTIYMEGGGQSRDAKSSLRQGMARFLEEIKESVRARRWKWNIVCCGSRNETYAKFMHERQNADDTIVVLLVDAEGPVAVASPGDHLTARDRWDMRDVDDNVVHLMVQAMETWIVADPDTLAAYYGQNFRRNDLPVRPNLEEENRESIARALHRSTQRTQKGAYHKIKHASDLLRLIEPRLVRNRCPKCARMFDILNRIIEGR